jgi:alkylation response protein AidB-like acyl-CoA dehydrogenase
MFSLWLPEALGGPQLNLVDYVQVIEELSRVDGSAGWCATVTSCLSHLAGYLQPDVAREIFGGGRTCVAGAIKPAGKAFATEGGYRVTGHWDYGSGILHSTWVLGNCIVHVRGGPRRGLGDVPELRLMIFPAESVKVIDTWHVSGLRFRVADLFVPEGRPIPCFGATPVQPGILYAVPMITALSIAIAAVPLGIARAAIDSMTDLAVTKSPLWSSVLLRDKPVFQADLGRAEALPGSARAFLFATLNELWGELGAGLAVSMRTRALVRLACTQAAQAAAQAVDLMYNAGGGTSLYESGRLERCFRDVHACTQHVATSASSYETAGRALLGLGSGRPLF